jgi:hypothetical protein
MDLREIREAINNVAKKIIVHRTGTIASNGVAASSTRVVLDNDDSGQPVAALSVAGPLAAGVRVSCLAYPPKGLVVLGPLGATASLSSLEAEVNSLQTFTQDSGWFSVGVGGNPAFQNSWGNFGSGWQVAQYRKVGTQVFLRGLVTGGASSTAIFTLPTGYRPASNTMVPAVSQGVPIVGTSGPASAGTAHTHSVGSFGTQNQGIRMDILTTGAVTPAQITGYVWFSGSFWTS